MARLIAGQAVERTDVAKTGAGTLVLNASSQAVAAANKDRVAIYLSNTSAANPMWVALGVPAVASTGIRLAPGSTLALSTYTGAINVLGTAADVLAIAEI